VGVPWGKMQRTICLAVDTFYWDSVIGHFKMVSDSSSNVGGGRGVCLAGLALQKNSIEFYKKKTIEILYKFL
jgi:hypothetical protein